MAVPDGKDTSFYGCRMSDWGSNPCHVTGLGSKLLGQRCEVGGG